MDLRQQYSTKMATGSHCSHWPGERDPSHQDVASANERPDRALLSDFKRVLMSNGYAAGVEQLFHTEFKNEEPPKLYTYPLALLSRFPLLPAEDRMIHLSQHFVQGCSNHVFFKSFPTFAFARDPIIPPLRLGISCLGSVFSRDDRDEARSLFLAGTSLWPVMVEVDNGLSRSIEMLLAAVLLVPYGVLAETDALRRRSTLIISSSITVARRMRLNQPGQLEQSVRQQAQSYSPLVWSLWLWDIFCALHSGLPLNLSSHEILSNMPSSTVPFREVYRDLLQECRTTSQPRIPATDSRSPEQATLLLLAVLSDSITIRRSLGSIAHSINMVESSAYTNNPFTPYSAHTELERMQDRLNIALDRWHNRFGHAASGEIMALYHYCRLYLSCPAIDDLSQLAGYQQCRVPSRQRDAAVGLKDIDISDRSVNNAWTILDVAVAGPKTEVALCPVWMPIVIFHASLVVWGKIGLSINGDRDKIGSIRALIAFKVELEAMPWPCCAAMAMTLQNLMSSSV